MVLNSNEVNTRAAEALSEIARIDLFGKRRRVFTLSHEEEVAANGGTVNVYIDNPEANTNVLQLGAINMATQFRGRAKVYHKFDSVTGGDAIPVANVRLEDGEQRDTSADAKQDVDFTPANGTFWETTFPSGGQGGQVTGGAVAGPTAIIAPGRRIVLELTNNSGKSRPGSIAATLVEREPKEIDRE